MNPLKMLFVGAVSVMLLVAGIVIGGIHGVTVGLDIVAALGMGLAIGSIMEWIHEEKRMDIWEKNLKRIEAYYRLLLQWLSLKQEGKNLSEYLEFNGYKSVAVYGLSEAGERLIEELEYTDIEVKYVVDRNAENLAVRIPKYKPDDQLPDVDVMIVAAITSFQEIQEDMEKKVSFPIVSLEDLVYGLA